MKRLFVIFALCGSAWATTYNAATCNLSDVQAAYTTEQASKVDGDIIAIPNGTCTGWTSANAWTISPTNSLTFQGNTTITFPAGMSAGNPATAHDNTSITYAATTSASMWTINVANGKVVRVTGLTIITRSGDANVFGVININGSCAGTGNTASVRFDHNHFNDVNGGNHTVHPGSVCGVFDHNFFDSTNNSNVFFFQFLNSGPSSYGDARWSQPINYGTSNFLFVETNFFQNGTFVYDCFQAGTYVSRFNIVGYNTRLQRHGVISGPDSSSGENRGCMGGEDYENSYTFTPNTSTTSFSFLDDHEGGSDYAWGETVTGFCTDKREEVPRTGSGSGNYDLLATPTSWGACHSTPINNDGYTPVAGPSNWDQNVSGQNGWRCLDGIGNGPGDLLSGNFPTRCDATLGSGTPGGCGSGTYNGVWSNQVAKSTYVWDVTVNNSSYCGSVHLWGNTDAAAKENRDYYLQIPNTDEGGSFNGTAGIGQGTRASRPSTCTTGVAWWSTDQGSWNTSGGNNPVGYSGQGVLDICTATNTWTNGSYVPYTYPHPLTNGSGGSVSLTPGSENYGSVAVGLSSAPVTFTLTNGSLTTATSISPAPSGGNSGDFSVTNSGAGSCATGVGGANSLTAGNSCTFTVTFTPGSTGSRSTTLDVTYSGGDGASPQTSALSGTGSGAAVAPSVTTTVASGITQTTASSGGTVTSNGGASVTSEGVAYGTSPNPTSPCTGSGTATPFTTTLSGLSPSTVYYYRACATNSAGTGYGSDLSFTTQSTCANPITVNGYTACNVGYNDIGSTTTTTVSIAPYAGNPVFIFGQFCGNTNCNAAPTQVFTANPISDNINSPETCFIQAPHSPYAFANTFVPDYETLGAWYAPDECLPAGITSFTLSTNVTVNYLQEDVVEWKAGNIAPTNYFESVDRTQNAGNVAGQIATVTSTSSTANPNDLLMAMLVTCGGGGTIVAQVGAGYDGLIVNPSGTAGHIVEAMGVTSIQSPATATTTWATGKAVYDNCDLQNGTSNSSIDTWFGLIVPLKSLTNPPLAPTGVTVQIK